jgi:YVTN family beta-propeller protein
MPYYGFLPNFRISDDEPARHGEWGYTGDSVPLAYQSWSNNKIVIAGIGAIQGDALDLAVWSNTTRAGVSWGGNAPPIPASAPVIKTVSISGAASNPAVTIKGSGFGPAPVAMPFTGQLGNLVIRDWRMDPDGAAPSGTWTTGVTERFTSWADDEIQISGFAGTFGHGPNVLRAGDPLTILISSTQGKSLDGPQTAWGGRLGTAPLTPTASPANPPLAAAKTAYIVNSASGTVTPISIGTGQAGAAIPVGANPGAIAITPDGKTAYVCPATFSPSSALIPISTATNRAGPAIPLTGDSFMIAITPNGKTVYVASSSYGTVTPISTATGKASPSISTGVGISAIAITPDSKTVYVAGVTGADPLGKLIPIATATNRPGPAIGVGKNPAAIVITPNGSTAYVLNTGSGSVTPISTAANQAGRPIPVGADPVALAITPNGKTAYVVDEITLGTVTPISLATNTPGPAISVGDHPDAIVITPDGKTAWVANLFSSTLTPVSTAINTAGPSIYIDSGAHYIAITPDGKTIVVTNGAGPTGDVTLVNTLTHQAGPAIKVGDQPTSIAITP